MIDRRSVIKGLGLLSVAPAIVSASSLMKVDQTLLPLPSYTVEAWVGEANWWYRLAIVRDAGEVRHYVNDVLVSEAEVLSDSVLSWLCGVVAETSLA